MNSYKIELFIMVSIWILLGWQFFFQFTLKLRGLYVLDRKVKGFSDCFDEKEAPDAEMINIRTANALGAGIRIYRHFGKPCIKYRDLHTIMWMSGVVSKQ